jgi:signal transduction histidine kinase
MRRRLVLAAAALTTTIVVAFAIPLGLLIRTVAHDRAVVAADRSARTLLPVLATVSDSATLDQVVAGVSDPATGVVSVTESDGLVIGGAMPDPGTLEAARNGAAFTTQVPGAEQVIVPVVVPGGSVSVVAVTVPNATLTQGVASAWLVLGALSFGLVAVAVAVADRLARAIVLPVGELASTAEQLSRGDLSARVEPSGPNEIVEVGETLNRLAGRITELLQAERELVADLSHRLRTPVTSLRLDTDALAEPAERERLAADVDELERAITQLIRQARGPAVADHAVTSDLAQVTRDRLAFWSVLAEEQDRRVESRFPDGPCPVAVSEDDLTASLDALLGNVLAHTPQGTALRTVVVPGPVSERGPSWTLIVEDEGPGFLDDATVERGTSGAASTGLGLDIVRRMAAGSAGSLELSRGATGGARVRVTLGPPRQA